MEEGYLRKYVILVKTLAQNIIKKTYTKNTSNPEKISSTIRKKRLMVHTVEDERINIQKKNQQYSQYKDKNCNGLENTALKW